MRFSFGVFLRCLPGLSFLPGSGFMGKSITYHTGVGVSDNRLDRARPPQRVCKRATERSEALGESQEHVIEHRDN